MMQPKTLAERMHDGEKILVGMVHCLPLPGTLLYGGDMNEICRRALADAAALQKVGVDAVIVENTNDKPFALRLEPEQVAALAAVARMVVDKTQIPVGIGASFSDSVSGIAIAHAAGASFIRSAVFVDTVHVTGLGNITPCAKEVLRMRKLLGAEHIGIWADVQVKHSHLVMPQVSLEESAQTAWEYGAQALITTGLSTGMETPIDAVARIKKAVPIPVVVGSGFHVKNAAEQLGVADGAIVGTAMKQGKNTMNPIDSQLAEELMMTVRKVREELKQ